MANVRHASKLREGARAWNAWRADNPDAVPDLSDLKLTAGTGHFGPDEGGPVDLSRANLRRAALTGADLFNARLDGADLSGADLRGANLGKAVLAGALLAGADLSGAWLGDASGLTQAQIDRAQGHTATVLPDYLAMPPGWLTSEAAAPMAKGAAPGAEEVGCGTENGRKPGKDSRSQGDDPYIILGVGRKASQGEIRAAYLRLAKELHPDGRAPSAASEDAAERLKLINDAYQKLKGTERQATARKAERRRRAGAVFAAGVMTAVAPLVVALVAGGYAAGWFGTPDPATKTTVPEWKESTRISARDSGGDTARGAPGTMETGAISVHVKEMDGGRGKALAAARKQGTKDAWERFIAACPDGETAAEAKAAIAAIERAEKRRVEEAIAWAKAEKSGEKAELQRFVAAHPDGAHAERARQALAAIERAEARTREEAIAWAKAEKSGEKAELQRFVAAYPDGAHAERARQALAAIERAEKRRVEEAIAWAKAEKSGEKAELQRFVAAHPDGAHAERARQALAAIERAEARTREEAIAWTKAEEDGEKAELQQFVAAYPDSAYAAQARRRIAQLEAEEKDAAAWLKAERRHNRAAYAGYLAAHPNGRRAADARLRMGELERAEARPAVEPVKAFAKAPSEARQRVPGSAPQQAWPSADEPFIGADGRIRR